MLINSIVNEAADIINRRAKQHRNNGDDEYFYRFKKRLHCTHPLTSHLPLKNSHVYNKYKDHKEQCRNSAEIRSKRPSCRTVCSGIMLRITKDTADSFSISEEHICSPDTDNGIDDLFHDL